MLVSASDVWILSGRWHASTRSSLFPGGEALSEPPAPSALQETAQIRGARFRHRLWKVERLVLFDYLQQHRIFGSVPNLNLHLMPRVILPLHAGLFQPEWLTAPQHISLLFPGKNEHQRTSQKCNLRVECRAPAINGNIKRNVGTELR